MQRTCKTISVVLKSLLVPCGPGTFGPFWLQELCQEPFLGSQELYEKGQLVPTLPDALQKNHQGWRPSANAQHSNIPTVGLVTSRWCVWPGRRLFRIHFWFILLKPHAMRWKLGHTGGTFSSWFSSCGSSVPGWCVLKGWDAAVKVFTELDGFLKSWLSSLLSSLLLYMPSSSSRRGPWPAGPLSVLVGPWQFPDF